MVPSGFDPHKDAGRAFTQGFAGCLGVGLAIVAVFILLVLFVTLASHH